MTRPEFLLRESVLRVLWELQRLVITPSPAMALIARARLQMMVSERSLFSSAIATIVSLRAAISRPILHSANWNDRNRRIVSRSLARSDNFSTADFARGLRHR